MIASTGNGRGLRAIDRVPIGKATHGSGWVRGLALPSLAGFAAALAASAPAGPPALARPQTAARDPATLLREQIAEDFALADASTSFTTSNRSATDLRQLLRERMDANVLDGARALRGSDQRFTPADGKPRHAGVIEIRYADARIAAARVRPLLGDRRFFRGTHILTPMVAAAHGDTVVLLFTENAGDAKLRATLATAAARLHDR